MDVHIQPVKQYFSAVIKDTKDDTVCYLVLMCPFLCVLVELERRIDFELREGLVESRYWSAVTSHTAYWCSYDVALFLLTFMYRPQEQLETADDNADTS